MTSEIPKNFLWEVYFKKELLGTASTPDERNALLKSHLGKAVYSISPGDIEFKLVKDKE